MGEKGSAVYWTRTGCRYQPQSRGFGLCAKVSRLMRSLIDHRAAVDSTLKAHSDVIPPRRKSLPVNHYVQKDSTLLTALVKPPK